MSTEPSVIFVPGRQPSHEQKMLDTGKAPPIRTGERYLALPGDHPYRAFRMEPNQDAPFRRRVSGFSVAIQTHPLQSTFIQLLDIGQLISRSGFTDPTESLFPQMHASDQELVRADHIEQARPCRRRQSSILVERDRNLRP